MARYVTSVATPLAAAEAFAYMADVTHFVEWDPGIKRVLHVAGAGDAWTTGRLSTNEASRGASSR